MVFSEKIDFLKTNDGKIFELSHLLNFYKKHESGFHENEKVGFKKIIKEAGRQTLNQINKIKVEKNDQTQGLLHIVCANNKYRMIKALVRRGADVNHINERRQTPLMVLFERHHEDSSILKSAEALLKSKNIDLSKEDQDKKTVHIYFDEYIKSLPKCEDTLALVKNGTSKEIMTEDANPKQKFMKKSQSTRDLSLLLFGGSHKNPHSILNKENRAAADKMLEELNFYCGAHPKRISPNLEESKVKEKRPKGISRSQSSSNLFSHSKKPVDPISSWFDKTLSCSTKPEGFKEIKDKHGHGHVRAYFDLISLREQITDDDDFKILKEKIGEGDLKFAEEADKGIKKIDEKFFAYVNGVKRQLIKEMGVGDISRVFFFKVRSNFGSETLLVATVYDPKGLHKDGIKSFKERIKHPFHLNLPEIEGRPGLILR